MPDYQKGKIYKLWSPQGNEIYIGSTINPLAKRLGHHKSHYNNCNSKYLFENYDVVKIELIEEYPCNNKMEIDVKGNILEK
jgi:predicted GIY-YIG superfamily endonuclease